KYTDKDGVERTTTDIVANVLRLLEKLEGGADNRFPSSESGYTGSSSRSSEPASVAVNADPSPDEQLPF
ncbi:MAG: single-stranded DNA-binding protein, partial [Bacteroidota bacterium]